MFSFVDQITEIGERRARGRFAVPEQFGAMPQWLIAEAIGQLAAWVAMAACGFQSRPIAALVGEIALGRPAATGVLDLEIEIERADDRAVLYCGSARARGVPVAEMRRCLGPMVPMEDFDDPAAVRDRFERLRSAGRPQRWTTGGGAPGFTVASIERPSADLCRGELHVPQSAAFFADHFPRKPVFPATLLLGALSRPAAELAADTVGVPRERMHMHRVKNVKVRTFTSPGQVLEMEARLRSRHERGAELAASATYAGRRVASARFEFELLEPQEPETSRDQRAP